MMKSHFTKLLGDIFFKLNIKLSKIDTDIQIIKELNSIKNLNSRLIAADKVLKKNLHNPEIYLIIATCHHYLANIEKFEYFSLYNIKKKEWIANNKLENLNLEFIWPGIVTGSLGNHYPLESLVYANALNLKKKIKPYLLLGNAKPRNQALFQKFLKYINVIYDKDLINKFKSLEEVLTLPLGLCLPLHNSCPYLDVASNITQNENQLLEKPHKLFSLNEEDESIGKKILENIGISKDSWFVTLHVRELGFRSESLKNTNFWRNSNINNYIDTIKHITNRGGWVFRMGDKSMTKLPEMKNVIDYAHHEIKSEFMDVYLGAKCKFCIGSPSGYYHIPMIFSKPILFTNSSQFLEYFGLRNNDMYLPKKLYYSDTKKIVSISEFSNSPISIFTSNKNFNNSNIFVQENSSDEIKEATIEMLKSLNSKNEYLTKKQIVFKDKVIKNSSLYDKNIVPKAKISSYFIEKNTDFI